MKLAPLVLAATVAAMAGCTTTVPTLPTSGPSSSPVVPSASTPAVPPSSTTPSPANPGVPSTVGAIDVSAYEVSMFSSPSGSIWCAVQKDAAWCLFPYDFKGKIPSSKKVCPGEHLDVTGINVTTKVEYFCSGDPTAFPVLNGDEQTGVEWFQGTGFPTVTKDGFKLATLPYGKKLAAGSFVCLSESSGVTCGDSAAGIGFKMAKAGVTIVP